MPVRIVDFHGVRKRSCTAAKNPVGSKPSRAMAKKILGWLNIITRRTDVIPAMAPTDINNCAHGRPTCLKASETGASMLMWLYGTMPVSTAATAIYRIVQRTSDVRMPIGTSREGLRASSACVEIESNPI